MVTISLLMLVYHEEENLREVLPLYSQHFDEVVVVHDGPCADQSLEIASSCGAVVIETPVRQGGAMFLRPLGLERVTCDWVLYLDADERLTGAFLTDMHGIAHGRSRRYDCILLWRSTYETRGGEVSRHIADQELPRFFKRGAVTWPSVPHIEAQGCKNASRYIVSCKRRQKRYVVTHHNAAEDFPEKHTRYIRIAKELWPSLKGTEWDVHMRRLFANWGIGEEVYDIERINS